MIDRQKILSDAHKLCHENHGELLYLCIFGSDLYGTKLKNKSDLDLRGIYYSKHRDKNIHYSTNTTQSKNIENDIDIDLYHLKGFLLEKLEEANIGALDILFSNTNPDCIIYIDSRLDKIFESQNKLVSEKIVKSSYDYIIKQGKKYGIKGSRLGELRKINDIIENCEDNKKLSVYADEILSQSDYIVFDENKFIISDKIYEFSIKMREMKLRIKNDINKYKIPSEIDYKALSHALRVCKQGQSLLNFGKITFPLRYAEELIEIKSGKIEYSEIEKIIWQEFDKLKEIAKNSTKFSYDINFAKNLLMEFK